MAFGILIDDVEHLGVGFIVLNPSSTHNLQLARGDKSLTIYR